MTLKAQGTKAKTDKGDDVKLKNLLCPEKETINRVKGNLWNWRKYLQNRISETELISRIHSRTTTTQQQKSK